MDRSFSKGWTLMYSWDSQNFEAHSPILQSHIPRLLVDVRSSGVSLSNLTITGHDRARLQSYSPSPLSHEKPPGTLEYLYTT